MNPHPLYSWKNHHERKIIYIPQSYLNRLADKKNDDEIIKIVRNTLEQEDLIKSIFNNVKINFKGEYYKIYVIPETTDNINLILQDIKGKVNKQAFITNIYK
jgi:hypothetical protein